MLFRKTKNLVGLDIGSSAIKHVELKDSKGGGFRLRVTGGETLLQLLGDGRGDRARAIVAVTRVEQAVSVAFVLPWKEHKETASDRIVDGIQ